MNPVDRTRNYFIRRITRNEPPPYPKRAAYFVIVIAVAVLVMLLLGGNGLGVSAAWAVAIGIPAGLLIAWILPIRVRHRDRS